MFDTKPAGKAFRDSLKATQSLVKAHSLSGTVIEIAIAILVLAILVGTIAFPIFFGTNTSDWGTTNILIWGVVPTVALAVVIIGLVKHFKGHGGAE
jgi:ABC-type proline/glycine betaine transport system permease subunit